MKRKIIISFLLLWCLKSNAQFHPILDGFSVFLDKDKAILKWVIKGGSTCNGINIYRSDDTLSSFVQIGSIAGICGSSASATPYEFTDISPIPNKINYYRLELGTQGFSGFTSVEFISISNNGFMIRPQPVIDFATIYFHNPSQLTYTFSVMDVNGKVVQIIENIDGESFLFSKGNLPGGIYIFALENKGYIKVSGKIIIK